MGARTLKAKQDLNYRRATKATGSCAGCDCFIERWPAKTMTGEFLREEPRCTVMGLQNSRRYRVKQNHVCDRFRDFGLQARRKLTGEEKKVLGLIVEGADVGGAYEAQTLRDIERRFPELLKIGRHQGDYAADEKLPFFGALLTVSGRRAVGLQGGA